MDAKEYQELAMATEADQWQIRDRILRVSLNNTKMIRLDTAARGLAGDVGEVCTCVQKYIEYGQELDEINLKEEVGDCLWRLAQICKALGINLEDVMISNIEKLKVRYPDKYSDEKAAEENRNREAERDALDKSLEELSESASKMVEVSTLKKVIRNRDMIRDLEKEPELGSVAYQLEKRYDDPSYPYECVFCKTKVYKSATRKICSSCSSKIQHSEIK